MRSLGAILAIAAIFLQSLNAQDCSVSYQEMLGRLGRKQITLTEFTSFYAACISGEGGNGYQPSCNYAAPETQAVAKIDRQGSITTNSGETISYHLKGVVSFQAIDSQTTKIYAVFTGVAPFYKDSDKFSLHVHQKGEANPSCSATGGHFNPCGKDHSDDPKSQNRHIGDVAKVSLTEGDDTLIIEALDTQVKLSGPLSVLGRAVTVHAGASAARVGCATIAVTEWEDGTDKHPDTNTNTDFWSN